MWSILSLLIIYTSDQPEQFQYFITPFHKRISESKNVNLIQNTGIEENFYLNREDYLNQTGFTEKLQKTTLDIERKIQKKKFIEAEATAAKSIEYFIKQLEKYPHQIEKSTLVQFYFWHVVALIDHPDKRQLPLNYLLFQTNISELTALQYKLSHPLSVKFNNLIKNKPELNTRSYTLEKMQNCELSLNGAKKVLETSFFTAPLHSIIGVKCKTGYFTSTLNNNTPIKIIVKPSIKKSVLEKPDIKFLPLEQIMSKEVHTIVIIHWSSKNNAIYATVTDIAQFPHKRELTLDMTTPRARQEASDKIEQFIFRERKSLLE